MNTSGLSDEPAGQGRLERWKKLPGGLLLVAFGIGIMLVHPGTLPLPPAAGEPAEEVLRLDGAPDVRPVRMNHAHQGLAAYLATSSVRPPPIPTTASYEWARRSSARPAATSRLPPVT